MGVRLMLLNVIVLIWISSSLVYAAPVVVSGGPENDYESSIVRLNDDRLMIIFDRNPDWDSGDLYVTFSSDDGLNWDTPVAIITDAGDQATLSALQLPYDTLRVWYASNESGTYQIYSAWSLDGLVWTKEGMVNLGWSSSIMHYDPTVIMESDSSLTMSYVVYGTGVYIAHCPFRGSWDTDKTQVSTSGFRPRVMKHSMDVYIYTYHKQTGGSTEYDVFVLYSGDRVAWFNQTRLTDNLNSHDPFIGELPDGSVRVYYAKHNGTAYNLSYREMEDIEQFIWDGEVPVTDDNVNNTQPHFIAENDYIYMVWAHAVDYPDDHDVYFQKMPRNKVASIPYQNEINVSASTSVTVTFDAEMDETSINDSTFVINGTSTGRHSGTIAYDNAANTATFTPHESFTPGEIVYVALTTSIRFANLLLFENGFSFSFTIESSGKEGTYVPISAVYNGVKPPGRLCAADFNNDGAIDIAAGDFYYSDTIKVFLNDGNANFTLDSHYTSDEFSSYSLIAADFNSDGNIDLATIPPSEEIYIYINNGSGKFDGPFNYSSGIVATTIFSSDLDNDGDMDISAVATYSHRMSIILNNGDATFTLDEVYASYIGIDPDGMYSADYDNDGDFDISIKTRNGLSVFYNNGAGGFSDSFPDSYSLDLPLGLTAGDYNEDGCVDMATNESTSFIAVLLNDCSDYNFESTDYLSNCLPDKITTYDLDGDGDLDLISPRTVCMGGDNNMMILMNNGDGTFADYLEMEMSHMGHSSVVAADFNGDGVLELAIGGGSIYILALDICGDVDENDSVNILDITYLVNFLYKSGPAPEQYYAGDVDGSGALNILDVTSLINYLYKGGPEPVCY